MPIYDFKCKECGHRFELFTSISRRDAATCPKCGGAVERVYEGKWSMCLSSAGASGGCSCGGNCQGCGGCGGR
ncbi:MAG: zinc ribbon domain-containing protein [Clostridia bacterium]|nr:zinc ribbon domain-containing protein [Clostridia bacterium]